MKLPRAHQATLISVILTLTATILTSSNNHFHIVQAKHLHHNDDNHNNHHQQQHHDQQQHTTNLCAIRPSICQNGATCVNKPGGGYQCICVNGWEGQNCTENVDDCSTAACENGAKCRDRVGHFFCECPPGKTGLLCQLDDGCFNNPCHPNATCDTSPVDGRAICTCPPGFSGLDCNVDNDECAAGAPCEHGGVCVNVPGTYRCECARGFTGDRCEVNINECEDNPCANGGTCLDEKGGFRCICPPGFMGQKCQTDIDECATNPCQNGATCKDEINTFRCLCPAGYWGERCEFNASSSRLTPPPIENPYLSPENPWSNCPAAFTCWTLFSDGKCDPDCNIAECLYDGKDCAPSNDEQIIPSTPASKQTITPKICDDKDSYCLRNYANGICDQECNSAECGWDGLDCEPAMNDNSIMPINTRAQGLLVIRVEPAIELGTDPESKDEITKLLRNLYSVTKTVLKIQSYRAVDEGRGTEIELIADNRRCQSSCFNSTDLIARFLTALRSKRAGFNTTMSAGLKINDIYSKPYDQLDPNRQSMASTIWVIVCGTLATMCTVLMVISIGNKQKVKEKAIVWFPEGFKPVLSSRNRDPTDRDRKSGRGVSTLQALGGNFFRGVKRNERNVSTDPNGLRSTDIDRCTATPSGGGIYHEPYDYDQYGSTYNGTDSIVNNVDEPMTPTPMSVNPLNIEGPHGLTPLMVASMGQPFSKEPLGLVAYGTTCEVDGSAENNVTDLLNRGAQLNLASKVTGETALHLAARCGRADNASRLLAHCDSKDVNAKDSTGRTPLHAAIAADSLGVFELLIRNRGTDLNAQTHDGTTPLILAAKVGNYSMLEELILNECEVAKSDANGKTALHWAAAVNNVDIIRRLLAVRETNKDAQDLAEETPLFLAAREGARGAVEILLSHNANRDIKDQMDMSPMDIARTKKHDDIVRLLEEHEPPTPRSMTGLHHSRQISPLSPESNSNSNGSTQPPVYHSHTQSNGGRSQGGRQAQKAAALARSSSTKPLIAEANIIRNNLQSHCKSVMVIKSEERGDSHDATNHQSREAKTLGRRATQSTSSSHQAIQPNMHHVSQFAALSASNVVMPATPNSLTNSLSPVSSSMMSPPTSHSLHHLGSPTKTNPPVNINQMSRSQQQNHLPPPSYNECQTFWSNNNNNPNMVNVNNNIIDQKHGLSEVYNVPCLKNYMTPSPDSPFSLESMASPPGVYADQQYQNMNHSVLSNQKQAGVFI